MYYIVMVCCIENWLVMFWHQYKMINFIHVGQVTKLLTKAAGIFAFIADNAANRFFVFPKDMPLPEVFPETFTLLQRLSLAEAQELVTKRAIMKENNPEMAAQLCAAAGQEYEYCVTIAEKIQIPEKPKLHLIKLDTRTYLAWKASLWKSLALKMMAEKHIRKHEPGYAVAYLEKASDTIRPTTCEAPIAEGNTIALWQQIDVEAGKIFELLKATVKDNDNIYHEVIRRDSLIYIEPKMMAKTSTFEAPQPAEVTINKKDLAGMNLCSIQ